MPFFSTILLLNTLRGLLEELEQEGSLDPNNPALVQLKHTLRQQIADLVETGRSEHFGAHFQDAA